MQPDILLWSLDFFCDTTIRAVVCGAARSYNEHGVEEVVSCPSCGRIS